MPINKFNQHYLSSNCSDETVGSTSLQASSFYICQPSNYHSKCILTIRGTKGPMGYYQLENNSNKYTMPVTGKIENVKCYPTNLQVLYKTEIDHINILNENRVTKGDELQFAISLMSDSLFVEFVIQCPLEEE